MIGMTLRLNLKESWSFAWSPGTLSLQSCPLPWTPVPMLWEALCTWGDHLGVLWWSAQLSRRLWDFAAQVSVRWVMKPPAASSPQECSKSLSRLWVFLAETPDLAERRWASPLCPAQIPDSRNYGLNKSDCFIPLDFGVICYIIGNWNK